MVATGFTSGDTRKVNVAGDTMTGDLALSDSSPDTALSAASRGYVDAAVGGVGAIPLTQKGAPGGVAELDGAGLLPHARLPAIAGEDITSGTVAAGRLPVGTVAATVAAGNDPRLGDARTPTAHKTSHQTGGTDAITPAMIGAEIAGAAAAVTVSSIGAATDAALTAEAVLARAAEALIVPRWQPATAYALNQQVVSPNNDVVNATVAHTSSAAYATDLAKWGVSSTYGLAAGANLGRFIKRAQAGEDLSLVCIGDSVLEGTTVTNPATEDTMHLLPVDLAARFGGVFTATNLAVSGYTAATSYINGKVRDAVAAAADLYIIAFGKNDTGWERETAGERPVPGYDTPASIGMLEQAIRLIRLEVPKADIIVMSENPYTPLVSTANDLLQAYHAAARRVAATYGCEFVDAYTAFATSPTALATLVPDGTHPGTLGHRLMADTILARLPASFNGPAITPGRPDPTRRTAGAQNLDTTGNLRGWNTRTTTGTTGTGTWANTGAGWAGSAPYVTSTPGDYTEIVFTGTELLATLSTLAADNAVVDIAVDTVPLYTARNLTQGKQGLVYVVPLVTGLSNAVHTVRVTLVSGTLKVFGASWTEGGTGFVPSVVVVDLGAALPEAALDTGGAIYYAINNAAAVPLPAGWSKMAVVFTGYSMCRVTGVTAAERLITSTLRVDLVVMSNLQMDVPARAAGDSLLPFTHTYTAPAKTAAVGVRFEMRVSSTDKTGCKISSWGLQATCHRLA